MMRPESYRHRSPEITDVVMGVAVRGPKACGRNGFQDEVSDSCGNPEHGCTHGA